jgi:hypothetical protein
MLSVKTWDRLMLGTCSGAVALGIAGVHYIGGASRVFWAFTLFDVVLLGFAWSALRSQGIFGARGVGAVRADDERGFRKFFYGVLVLVLLAQLMGVVGTVINVMNEPPVR